MNRSIVRLFGCSSFRCLAAPCLLLLSTAYCLLCTAVCSAQEKAEILKYARSVIDTLCSPSMHGRGYVNKGDSIAADYLKKELEKLGVSSLGKEFYQQFEIKVNIFSKPIKFSRGEMYEDEYYFGNGFLIHPQSPPLKGQFKTIKIDSTHIHSKKNINEIISRKYKNKFLLIDTIGMKDKEEKKFLEKIINDYPYEIKGVLVLKEPLIQKSLAPWGVASYQSKYPIIEVPNWKRSNTSRDRKIDISIEPALSSYVTKNVLGYIPGVSPDTFIVFSAHYDHLGEITVSTPIGDIIQYFPGANDNASGCAMLLNLAKYYSQHPPKYSIAFMAFGAEEAGLIGSKYYVDHPLFPLKQIKFLVNMDIMGTGDEGIKVVNATEHKKEFDELVRINSEKKLLPSVQPRGKAKNSDHYFFEEAGVKTFFIYTLGGIKAYHDIYDRPETLPLTKFNEIFILLTEFVKTF